MSLRILNISANDIGDSGMLLLSEELQHNYSILELWVEWCGISSQGKADKQSSLSSVVLVYSHRQVFLFSLFYQVSSGLDYSFAKLVSCYSTLVQIKSHVPSLV